MLIPSVSNFNKYTYETDLGQILTIKGPQNIQTEKVKSKVITQEKLFQRCTHLLYCSVLSMGGNVNTRRMLHPDMGSIFHIIKINEIFWS